MAIARFALCVLMIIAGNTKKHQADILPKGTLPYAIHGPEWTYAVLRVLHFNHGMRDLAMKRAPNTFGWRRFYC